MWHSDYFRDTQLKAVPSLLHDPNPSSRFRVYGLNDTSTVECVCVHFSVCVCLVILSKISFMSATQKHRYDTQSILTLFMGQQWRVDTDNHEDICGSVV